MTAFLDVIAGPHAGSSIPLTDGMFRFGRSGASDYALGGDHFLSDVHFVIGIQGRYIALKDLGSLNGTFVNGKRVEEARLMNGDRVLAGHSAFGLRVAETAEGSLVLPQRGPVPPRHGWPGSNNSPRLTPAQNRAMDVLAMQHGTLFAVLDAARDSRILPFLNSQPGRFQSLYNEEKAKDYAWVSPYLLLTSDSTIEQLLQFSWQLSWGIYLFSPMTFEGVRRHLRKFLIAETEDGKRFLFRFYDPRVLRVYLPSCDLSESLKFLGDNYSIVLEDETPEKWMCFEHGAAGVKIDFAQLEGG